MPKLACRKCYSFKIDNKGKCINCKSNRYVVPIDSNIAEEIKALWELGVFTDNCCEGHLERETFYSYVMFSPSYPFCDWLKTVKDKYEKNFFPLSIDIYDRGFSQFVLKEHKPGEFTPEKKEKYRALFKYALKMLAEDYIVERKRILGA